MHKTITMVLLFILILIFFYPVVATRLPACTCAKCSCSCPVHGESFSNAPVCNLCKKNGHCQCSHKEKLISPGYANRFEVNLLTTKTYGGTDNMFKEDPRFGI